MATRIILFTVFCFFLPGCCEAQFTDNFSDGDFTLNPTWEGDQSKFSINSGRMRLAAPAVAGNSYLATPSVAIHNGIWEIFLQLDFTPSSSNYAKIYLTSDQTNLTGPLNGYFVKAGNTSREVSLYRQSGMNETEIIDGLDDRLNVPIVKMRIRVTRSGSGDWQLFSDIGPSGAYLPEGSVTDQTYTTSSYFGVHCTYSATRSDKFWFDDVVVSGTSVPDTTPPVIQSMTVPSASEINLYFSELLEPQSAQQPEHFLLSNAGTLTPELQINQKIVVLKFSNPLTNGVTYDLKVFGVRDLAGNTMLTINLNVLFFLPEPAGKKDVIFTEIFPDPSPQVGLPAAEFVEIYNRSRHPFDMSGWKFSDGNSVGEFSKQIILPGEYWIVASSSNRELYTPFGKTLRLTNFPSLNNNGDVITLRDAAGKLIDSVNYNLDWYQDIDKQEGGWTLELIDPENPCGGQDNWSASESTRGGTPGMQNSILANKPDLTEPRPIAVLPESRSLLSIRFSEALDPSSLALENFSLKPSIAFVRTFFKDISLTVIHVELEDTLRRRQTYSLEISNVRDCSGNRASISSIEFGVPERADSLDIIVNEILFNPSTGGVDFVEFRNVSLKFLQLRNWKIANDDGEGVTGVKPIMSNNMLLPPNGYVVFTTDPILVELQYPNSIAVNLIKTPLPSLPDDGGSIAIVDDNGKIVDKLSYSSSWHSAFLKSEEGVSLERIESVAPTQDSHNWTSASSRAGFATPGYVNSQQRIGHEFGEVEVVVVPEIFEAGAGVNDFTEIQYRFDVGGAIANVAILNYQGTVLKTISNNEILGPSGFLRWDGDRDDGSKAPAGYYIVWFEVFLSNGNVQTFRRRVIVASK